jgi:hypothetical protein
MNIKTKYSKEILQSLKPDNINLPDNMKIFMDYNSDNLQIEIHMKIVNPKDVLTLRNTADEILMHVKTLIEVLDNLK